MENTAKNLENEAPEAILGWALKHYQDGESKGSLILACSLSLEDTVLAHMLSKLEAKIPVFILDTGRLHETSYELLNRCRLKYNLDWQVYSPNHKEVERLVSSKGPFSFYESLENRKECCNIRKVQPLKRALKGYGAWITGIRREQSPTRSKLEVLEENSPHKGITKLSPLLHWTWDTLYDYAKKNNVPIHPLHKQGYPSIGCAPCTRAVRKGESIRSGRWWWEDSQSKECGLHRTP